MIRRGRLLSVGAGFATLIGIAAIVTMAPSERIRDLDGMRLAVPAGVTIESVPLWLRMTPGLDQGAGELLVRIPAERVADHVPGYVVRDGDVLQDQLLVITALNVDEEARYRLHPLMYDVIAHAGRYSDAIVKAYPEMGVWSVGTGPMFDLFHADPATFRRAEDAQAAWMGMCQEMSMVQTASGTDWLCSDYVLTGRLLISFHYGRKNLPRHDALRHYLSREITAWVVTG